MSRSQSLLESLRSSLLVLVTFSFLAGCGADSAGPVALDEVHGPFTWGSADKVMRVRNLWISGQPDEGGLTAARDADVKLVLDLRAPGERDWDEAAVAKRLGLEYHNIAVPGQGRFPEAAFTEIETLVRAHTGEQILIHCSSGNRAAAWLTTHLVSTHRMPFSEALAVGKRTGITKREIVEKTAQYLGEETRISSRREDHDVPSGKSPSEHYDLPLPVTPTM